MDGLAASLALIMLAGCEAPTLSPSTIRPNMITVRRRPIEYGFMLAVLAAGLHFLGKGGAQTPEHERTDNQYQYGLQRRNGQQPELGPVTAVEHMPIGDHQSGHWINDLKQ